MDTPLAHILESVASILIVILGITFIGLLLSKHSKYDKYLLDRNVNKSTSHYTMAYSDFDAVYDSSCVLNDILSANEDIYVSVNGTMISDIIIKGAREGNETDINAIKNFLSGNYKKSYAFDADGVMVGLVYTGV